MNKHYYIPTSSMNLETILQSESISPCNFYPQRIAGSTIFEPIPQYADIKNAIVLLDKPIRFAIDDPGRYNFPMLIEVCDDKQLNDHSLNSLTEGVYAYGKTINLTPSNCRIIFFEKRHFDITTINVKDSRAVKYYKYYKIVNEWNTAIENLPTLPLGVTDNWRWSNDNKETQQDKIKGLLYASMLGQSMSINGDLAKLRRVTQEIYNILVAIISSPSSLGNYRNKLNSLLEEYRNIEPETRKCKENHESYWLTEIDGALGPYSKYPFLAKLILKTIKDILAKFEVWGICERRYAVDKNYNAFPAISDLRSIPDFENLKSEIVSRYDRALSKYQQLQTAPHIKDIQITNEGVVFSSKRYLDGVIKYIIVNKVTPDYLVSNKLDLCVAIVNQVVKPVYLENHPGEQWNEATKERAYFISLYNFLCQSGERFNVRSIEDEELQAIAAFIYAGADITALDNYLKVNEVCNYNFAMSLWGVLNGYVSIPKEVLQSQLSMEIYQTIHRKMYGYDVEGVMFDKLPEEESALLRDAKKTLTDIGIPFNQEDERKLQTVASLESHIGDPLALLFIIDNVLNKDLRKTHYHKIESLLKDESITLPDNDNLICEFIVEKAKIAFKKDRAEKMSRFKECIMKAIDIEKRRDDHEAFILILDNYYDRRSTIYKALKEKFWPSVVDGSKDVRQLSLLDMPTPQVREKAVCILPNIWDNPSESIVEYIRNKGFVNEALLKNLKSLLDGYAPGGWARSDTDNKLVNGLIIRHFENYCFSTKNYEKLEDVEVNKTLVSQVGKLLRQQFK